MSFFRITLHRSFIGMPQRTRDVLAALGLHRRGQIVFQPVGAQAAGMIMKVKELVRVEEVERALTKRELQDSRRPDKGFWLESRAGVSNAGGKAKVEGAAAAEEEEVRL